jgi:DNA modification methylase
VTLPPPEFLHLDCREFLHGLQGTADLIVTSPPYVDARDPEAYGIKDETWHWSADDNDALAEAMFAALRPGGTAIVNVNVPIREYRKGHRSERSPEIYQWILLMIEHVGFTFRDDIIYHRTGAVGAYEGRFRTDWEHVLWLERPGGRPTFAKGVMDRPAANGAYAGGMKGTRGRSGEMINRREVSGEAAVKGIVRQGNVWSYGNVGKGSNATPAMEEADHPAAFCLPFALDAIGCFSKPGDLVVDPFHGRGTVAVAARRLGRQFKGSDLGHNREGRSWNLIAEELTRMDFERPGRRSENTAAHARDDTDAPALLAEVWAELKGASNGSISWELDQRLRKHFDDL